METYKALCTAYYELDKPNPPQDALAYYLARAAEAKGPILEPMCGTGRFLIPLLKKGYTVTGFDSSSHMLRVCQEKCKKENLHPILRNASFQNFETGHTYKLIFIPSGSFSLLTTPDAITQALTTVHKHLDLQGKFVFEVDTLKTLQVPQETWRCNWLYQPDGAQLVLHTFSRFDETSRVNTTLCKYELWKNNKIIQTEVENFLIRLYQVGEVDEILKNHGALTITKQVVPYTNEPSDQEAESILYECKIK